MREQIDGLLITSADQQALRELLAWFSGMRRNPQHARQTGLLPHTRDVYLARAHDGIPAMTAEAGTGTDSSVGIISKADCKCYRIDDQDPNIDVDPIGVSIPVYNTSLVEVPADTLFLAVCTKDGMYVAVQLAGGGGGTGDKVEFTKPIQSGQTPPKPLLEDHQIVNYDLATDTVVQNGIRVWARNMNK